MDKLEQNLEAVKYLKRKVGTKTRITMAGLMRKALTDGEQDLIKQLGRGQVDEGKNMAVFKVSPDVAKSLISKGILHKETYKFTGGAKLTPQGKEIYKKMGKVKIAMTPEEAGKKIEKQYPGSEFYPRYFGNGKPAVRIKNRLDKAIVMDSLSNLGQIVIGWQDFAGDVFIGFKSAKKNRSAKTSSTTIIDLSKSVKNINNLNSLPREIKQVVNSADDMMSHGFQELNGYKGRQVIFSAGGHWISKTLFEIESIGTKDYVWSKSKGLRKKSKKKRQKSAGLMPLYQLKLPVRQINVIKNPDGSVEKWYEDSDGNRAIVMKSASRESQKLQTINGRIWRKHNWTHRGDVDNNWSTFIEEVKAGLKSAGIRKVTPEVMRELEDDNFHALMKALIDIGVASPKY